MMKKTFFTLILFCTAFSGFALTLKLGSLAPTGSDWDKSLRKIAAEWKTISKGKVILKIYPGGITGDEPVMIRKMRLNQLHGAAMTGVGLNKIYKGTLAVSIPMLIRTDDEFEYVLEKMIPFYDKKIKESRFLSVMWSFAGWVHWFGKKPIASPDDLKKQKMWIWKGNSDEAQMWRNAGFSPVQLDINELTTSLSSGMVEAFGTTRLSAAAYQWFGISRNMCELNWAPMLAGIVFTERAWKKIPKNYHEPFLEVLKKAGREIRDITHTADAEALKIMKEYGLKVQSVTPAEEAEWNEIVTANFEGMINKQIGREAYEEVVKHLEDYRQKHEK